MYVENTDEVYARALQHGARGVTEPFTSNITGDRMSRIADPLDNIWWMQTHLADPTPEEMQAGFQNPQEREKMVYLQTSLDTEMQNWSHPESS